MAAHHTTTSFIACNRSGNISGLACLVILTAFNFSTLQSAFAGGFLNHMQSAGAAAVSTAGETAIAEDATTIYYNPAGMTQFKIAAISLTAPIIFLSSEFQNNGTTAGLGDPARGSNANREQNFSIPSLFAALPLSDRVTVGLGVFAPFGQANTYSDDWIGRYHLQKISLKTVDIDPSIAFRLTDSLSVGAGIDISNTRTLYGTTRLTSAPSALRLSGPIPVQDLASDLKARMAASAFLLPIGALG